MSILTLTCICGASTSQPSTLAEVARKVAEAELAGWSLDGRGFFVCPSCCLSPPRAVDPAPRPVQPSLFAPEAA